MTKTNEYAFFLGCIMPNRYPQIEVCTQYLMKKLGYKLYDMVGATCCPAPGVFRSFDKLDWMVVGARNLCIAEKLGKDLLTVCNGCFGTLQEINLHLKGDEKARQEINMKLAEMGDWEFKGSINVRHIGEVLASDVGPQKIQEYLVKKVPARVAIHYGCHFLKPSSIREIDSSERPTLLEDFVEALGCQSLEFTDKLTCCGAGGGVKAAFTESSMAILGEKMENIVAVNPDFIFDVCPFCHLQFETGQDYLNKNFHTNYNVPVIHISQLVAFCFGIDESKVGMEFQIIAPDYKLPFLEVTK
ncbi:MAG: CoB--CoM heterodisulfide reductase subunit B [Promethearchaeota archaeon]